MDNNKRRIGFTCGAFDLLHTGHVTLFRRCRQKCDYLIVGLHTDPTIDRPDKNKPVQSMFERYIQLKACKDVDEIVPYDTEKDLLEMLNVLDLDVRFVGSEYMNNSAHITGVNIVPIEYVKRDHGFSTTELRRRIKNE